MSLKLAALGDLVSLCPFGAAMRADDRTLELKIGWVARTDSHQPWLVERRGGARKARNGGVAPVSA